MATNRFLSCIIILFSLSMQSCGTEELTNSKAEDIIQECLEKNPMQKIVRVRLKQASLNKKELEKYRQLEEEGVIVISETKPSSPKPKKPKNIEEDPLAKWRYEAEIRRYNRQYQNKLDIAITPKGQVYIEKVSENSKTAKFRSHAYEVDRVLEVHELPSLNTARVKVQFKPIDIGPFSVLYPKEPDELIIKDLDMTKTSNGWKYCDNF